MSTTAAKEIEDYTAEVYKVDHDHIEVNELEKLVFWVVGKRLERQEAGVGGWIAGDGPGMTKWRRVGTGDGLETILFPVRTRW